MLLNGGELNGKRLLGSKTVEVMTSVAAPDTLPGRPKGEGYGLSVRVVNDPMARSSFMSAGTFGWSGAFGTHFFVDPHERIVGILMAQTPDQQVRLDFENAVMHAIVGNSTLSGTH
jgi:CubicO group peptidase (beta-lactamase class C family)